MEFLTRLDFQDIGRRYVLGRAKRIDPTQVDVEGSDVNLLVGGSSFMAHAVSRQLAERTSQLMLETAVGEGLDRWLFDRYRMVRKGAGAAVTPVRMSRPAATAGAGTVAVGSKLLSLTGIEYVTLEPGVFGVSTLDNVIVRARAVQAGPEFQVGKNQIRRFEKPNLLFDPSIQVNNDEAAAGGSPREEDPIFKERGRDFWRSAQRGTLPAIEFGAKTVPGVESANATEALTGGGQPARVVTIAVADPSGVSNTALGLQVLAALDEWRCAGIAVVPTSSIPQIVSVVLKLVFVANVDTVALSQQIRSNIVEYINSLGVNRPLLRSDLGAVLARFKNSGLIADDQTIVEPTGDLVPVFGRTLRTRPENVTLAA